MENEGSNFLNANVTLTDSQGRPLPADNNAATSSIPNDDEKVVLQGEIPVSQEEQQTIPEEDIPDFIKEMQSDMPHQQAQPSELTDEEKRIILAEAKTPEEIFTKTKEILEVKNSTKQSEIINQLKDEVAMLRDLFSNINQEYKPSSETPVSTKIQDLPEYKELQEARKRLVDSQSGLSNELDYETCLKDYEEKLINFNLVAYNKQFAPVLQSVEKAEILRAGQETDAKLEKEWQGDLIHPMSWIQIKNLFSTMVEKDKSILARIPKGTPQDRAEWIERQVHKAYPKEYAIAIEKARKKAEMYWKEKQKKNPLVSGSSPNQIKGQSKSVKLEDAYMGWLKSNE